MRRGEEGRRGSGKETAMKRCRRERKRMRREGERDREGMVMFGGVRQQENGEDHLYVVMSFTG